MSGEHFDFAGDGDHRDDLTPGADTVSDQFSEVDPEFDYEQAAQTWIGETATTELTIYTVGDYQEKKFVLEMPSERAEMEQRFVDIVQNDIRAFCEGMVREPTLTDEIWEEGMSEHDRQLLFDLAFAWGRFGDFEMMGKLDSEVRERLAQMA